MIKKQETYLESTKTARSLLVHLGTRRHSVDSQVNQFSRTDNFK